jgi:hypothetical protein
MRPSFEIRSTHQKKVIITNAKKVNTKVQNVPLYHNSHFLMLLKQRCCK